MTGSSSTPAVVLFAVLETADRDLKQRGVALLSDQVRAHEGHFLKQLADGVMAVFQSPVDALSCAIDMQHASSQGLRIGLALGEPLVSEDDYFGTPVVVARRLCDRAGAGQILCNSLISQFESARERTEFRSLGTLELKGISTPVSACEVLERYAGNSG